MTRRAGAAHAGANAACMRRQGVDASWDWGVGIGERNALICGRGRTEINQLGFSLSGGVDVDWGFLMMMKIMARPFRGSSLQLGQKHLWL